MKLDPLESRVLCSVTLPPAPIVGLAPAHAPLDQRSTIEIDFQLPVQAIGPVSFVTFKITDVTHGTSTTEILTAAQLPGFGGKHGWYFANQDHLARNSLYLVQMTETIVTAKGPRTSPFSVAQTIRTRA